MNNYIVHVENKKQLGGIFMRTHMRTHMNYDQISKVWIDDSDRLCIQPRTTTFELIYRSAMGVRWNESKSFLYPASIGSWSPVEWFRQILSAVETEYGYKLEITKNTKWENIDALLKHEIEMESNKRFQI